MDDEFQGKPLKTGSCRFFVLGMIAQFKDNERKTRCQQETKFQRVIFSSLGYSHRLKNLSFFLIAVIFEVEG